MRPVFLIGFIGCGKTTLGQAAGSRTGLRFIDLDALIEERCLMTVAQIFTRHGQEGFRRIERHTLTEAAAMTDVIVACGGGTPCFFDNIDLMNSAGLTVRLDASEETLLRRLKAGRDSRPLLAGKSDDELARFISDTLASRMPYYSKAAASFPSDRLETIEEIDETVNKFVNTFNLPLKP